MYVNACTNNFSCVVILISDALLYQVTLTFDILTFD